MRYQHNSATRAMTLFIGAIALSVLLAGSAGRARAQAASPTPPLQIQGQMTVLPDHGYGGAGFTVSATGLDPGMSLDVVWTDVDGAWRLSDDGSAYLGRQFTPHNRVLTTVTPDGSGSVSTTVSAPSGGFGDEHDVLLQRGDRVVINKAGFNVDMAVSIAPVSGPVGTPITITAQGIGFRAGDDSWQLDYDSAYTGWLSAVTTHGTATAVIPATGDVGVHVLNVLHGDYTFPYLNTQQSPYAGRPEWHLPFTITSGDAMLPPGVAQQVLTTDHVDPAANSTVQVGPPAGIVGSTATVTAAGLPPDTDLSVLWSSVRGNRISGQPFSEATGQLGTAHTDAQGALVWSLQVPDDLGGSHALSLRLGEDTVAQGTYTITPSAFPLETTSGPSGSSVLLHLKGVGWTQTANIYTLDYDNHYAGYACGFNSDGDVQIPLVVSGAPGWHYLDLYPAIYQGQESNPINFRVPQLTFNPDHPGEQLPAFHFAYLITTAP